MEFTRHHLSSKDCDCKFNVRRAAKRIDLKRRPFRLGEKLVIKKRDRQPEVISDIHKGIRDSANSSFASARDKT